MKAVIVYRRIKPYSEGTVVIEEVRLKKELEQLQQKYHYEIVCVLHISFALRVNYIEFPKLEVIKAKVLEASTP